MVLPKSKYDPPQVEIVEYHVEGGITGDYTFYVEDDTKKKKWEEDFENEIISEFNTIMKYISEELNKEK